MPDKQEQPPQERAEQRRTSDIRADDSIHALPEPDRLFNEANLLRLEGRLFCFDPKEAARRAGAPRTFVEKLRLEEVVRRPLLIKPDPEFGYPSPLAYKVLQAISKKLTEEGFPVPDSVSFSQRELARLIGALLSATTHRASSTGRSCSSTRRGCSAPSTTRKPTSGRP
jgi:hypothetical protein